MKFSQIQFTLIVATLVVLCSAAYKAGQNSVQPRAMVCAELPAPKPKLREDPFQVCPAVIGTPKPVKEGRKLPTPPKIGDY